MVHSSTDPQGRSVTEIEREVERERKQVSQTIDELQARANMGNVVEQIMKFVGENGGEAGRNLGRTLRDNPLPVLLTGVGLAWLMAGGGGPRLQRSDRRYEGRFAGDYDPYEDWDEDEEYAYLREQSVATPPLPSRVASGGTTFPSSTEPSYPGTATDSASGSSISGSESLRDKASDAASRIGEGVRTTGEWAREGAAQASEAVRQRVSGAGAAISEAGEAARLRTRHARWRAMEAGRHGRENLESLMQDQPLVFGALALAVGAAIGGALPPSDAENRLFGRQSSKLKSTARRIAEAEGKKLEAAAEAVAREAGDMVDEAAGRADAGTPSGREAVERAEAGVRKAASRLAEAGRAEAERQHLGESLSGETSRTKG